MSVNIGFPETLGNLLSSAVGRRGRDYILLGRVGPHPNFRRSHHGGVPMPRLSGLRHLGCGNLFERVYFRRVRTSSIFVRCGYGRQCESASRSIRRVSGLLCVADTEVDTSIFDGRCEDGTRCVINVPLTPAVVLGMMAKAETALAPPVEAFVSTSLSLKKVLLVLLLYNIGLVNDSSQTPACCWRLDHARITIMMVKLSSSRIARISFVPHAPPTPPPSRISRSDFGRYFELAMTRSGYELVTNPIPFDAVALGSDETPAASTTDSLVTCENDEGNNDDECPESRLQKSGSMQMKVRDARDVYSILICGLEGTHSESTNRCAVVDEKKTLHYRLEKQQQRRLHLSFVIRRKSTSVGNAKARVNDHK